MDVCVAGDDLGARLGELTSSPDGATLISQFKTELGAVHPITAWLVALLVLHMLDLETCTQAQLRSKDKADALSAFTSKSTR